MGKWRVASRSRSPPKSCGLGRWDPALQESSEKSESESGSSSETETSDSDSDAGAEQGILDCTLLYEAKISWVLLLMCRLDWGSP